MPLVRALNKHGIRVPAAYFLYVNLQGKKGFINERLLNCCNYAVNIAGLKDDNEFKLWFPRLSRKANAD